MSRQRCHTPRHHTSSQLNFQIFPEHWLCTWIIKTPKSYFLSFLSTQFPLYHQMVIVNNNYYICLADILYRPCANYFRCIVSLIITSWASTIVIPLLSLRKWKHREVKKLTQGVRSTADLWPEPVWYQCSRCCTRDKGSNGGKTWGLSSVNF